MKAKSLDFSTLTKLKEAANMLTNHCQGGGRERLRRELSLSSPSGSNEPLSGKDGEDVWTFTPIQQEWVVSDSSIRVVSEYQGSNREGVVGSQYFHQHPAVMRLLLPCISGGLMESSKETLMPFPAREVGGGPVENQNDHPYPAIMWIHQVC